MIQIRRWGSFTVQPEALAAFLFFFFLQRITDEHLAVRVFIAHVYIIIWSFSTPFLHFFFYLVCVVFFVDCWCAAWYSLSESSIFFFSSLSRQTLVHIIMYLLMTFFFGLNCSFFYLFIPFLFSVLFWFFSFFSFFSSSIPVVSCKNHSFLLFIALQTNFLFTFYPVLSFSFFFFFSISHFSSYY